VISVALSPRVAVLRRSDRQYAYTILQITNHKRRFDGDAQFGPLYALWAGKGFRVADYFVLYDWCWPGRWDDNGNWEPVDCTYHSQALLEQQKDAEIPQSYKIASARLTFSKEKLDIWVNETKRSRARCGQAGLAEAIWDVAKQIVTAHTTTRYSNLSTHREYSRSWIGFYHSVPYQVRLPDFDLLMLRFGESS
jgi:hypothetical protein